MAAVVELESPGRTQAVEGVRAQAGSIEPMDGLRGVAVAWIVLFHFLVLGDAARDPWLHAVNSIPVLERAIRCGPFAVDLFFVLSGFLLALPWLINAQGGRPAPEARRFYARRILRIVPAYYVQLVLLFVVVMPLLHGATYWRSDLYVYAFNAVAHGLFLHNMTPLTSGSLGVNGALWTLAVEAQFYALLPVLAALFVRWPWRCLAAAAAISAGWIVGAREGFDGLVQAYLHAGRHWQWPEESIRRLLAIQFPAYLAHFALGAALGRVWLRWRTKAPAAGPAMLFAAAVAILVLTGGGWIAPLGAQSWLLSLAAIGAIVLAAAADATGWAQRVLGRGPVAFMGRISYSAYLWHLPLLALLQRYANAPAWALFPLYAAGVIAIGWLSWRFVERPFMQRGTARANRPPAP